ncbi:MAG: hypothetical protein K1562_11490 [Candidatus Thiodiazotropha sp. (ex. Lucinisca nassula)]|nr:hypothetical protein [Candidatus Thiodiazotropha sp. (ex. Lucinisca nassula)]
MKYFDSINRHKYIYLGGISEPEDNSLRLIVEEAGVSEDEKTIDIGGSELSGLRSIEVTECSCIYEVAFESYVAYSVRDESYALPDEYEVFEGRLICIYSKSHFLDYVSKSTFASDDHPGPYKNYGFNCLNHVVDVVSIEPPEITLISGRHLSSVSR